MLELILLALASIAIDIILTVAVLAFVAVVEWFLTHQEHIDDNTIGFTVRRHLDNGQYAIVQGLFDQTTDTVDKVRQINAQRLDAKLGELHDKDPLVVYS